MREETSKARVFIVDDHPIVRQGLAQLIATEPDLLLCGEASDVRTALLGIVAEKADIALVDLSLGTGDGIELIKNVRAQAPQVRFVVLTIFDDALHLERAVLAGAQGFLTKQEAPGEVLTAVREVLEGRMYLSRRVSPKLLMRLLHAPGAEADSPIGRLSDRELQVFQLVGEGKATKEIAELLHLSVKTIESYRANIKEKLELADAGDLSRYAMRWVLSHEQE